MVKKWLFLLLALVACGRAYAQEGTRLRISLLTCGPGNEEVWEVFGHSGVRVFDSASHGADSDIVYNYGTFEFGPDFEMQFMRGKLLYCSSVETFNEFMQEYVETKRRVEEQTLMLNWKETEHINDFLRWNAEPENKYYKYDYFFDNCATRIRDIFPRPEVFGKKFKYGQALPEGKRITFRDIINKYFYSFHWTRTGVNILLGSKIDKPMSNTDIMFLPDYLRDGIGGATVSGRKITGTTVLLLPGDPPPATGINGALILTSLIALLTIAGLFVKRLRVLGRVMSSLLLLATGLLGCLILIMWFATDHQCCTNNFNILWLLPTNIIIAFFNPKGKGKYSMIAIVLIMITLLLHVFRVQGIIIEFVPLLLALLFIFGVTYRNEKLKQIATNA
jgi:hypothetical protein